MKHFLALIFCLFTVSCSRIELVYKFAPKIAADKVDEAFDFESARYKEVRQQIEADLNLNKKEIVKNVNEVIDFLSTMAAKNSLALGDFQSLSLVIRQKQKILVYLFKPSFEKVMLGLNETETKSLADYSQKTFKKNDDLLLEKNSFVDKRLEGFEKLMDYFFDDTTPEQKAIYRNFIQNNFEYFKNQSLMRKEFMTQFRWPIADKAKLSEYALQYYSGSPAVRTSVYAAQLAQFEKNLVQIQLDLWLTVNKKQKDFFLTKLAILKANLLKLADK
jgi:hypothetical protein